jgi:predicted nucleic-acid-binding protein
MKALDTNVLVRFLVRDNDQQAMAVYKKFKQAEVEKEVLFIPILVVLEMIWVLESVYLITRKEILDSMDELLLMPVLEFEVQSLIRSFLSSARDTKMELSDLLIVQSAKCSGCESVLTFDKKASNYKLFELLK